MVKIRVESRRERVVEGSCGFCIFEAAPGPIRNTDLKLFADRLRKEGKPHKVVAAAVARKLVVIANALCKSRQPWAAQTG